MNYFISSLNMVQIIYSVNYGLRILIMIHISPIIIIISSQIKINMLFKINDARKRRMFDRKIHKAMRIPVEIHEINQNFIVTVQPKNACMYITRYNMYQQQGENIASDCFREKNLSPVKFGASK